MPLFRVQIFKRIGSQGKEWSNVYWVNHPDIDTAQATASDIALAEQNVHKANVTFVRLRVSSAAPGDNAFITQPINEQGAVPVASSQLPLFNTARIDFAVPFGRPSYKYLRLPIAETETADGVIQAPLASLLETGYMVPLVSISPSTPGGEGLVDESGNGFVSASVFALIQERQLRRRKRKKTDGGLSGS